MSCDFLDKEIGSFRKTTDENGESYIEAVESVLLKSTDSGKTLKEMSFFKDKFVSWVNIQYPYLLVYTALDKFNVYNDQELFISNDSGESFQKAIAPIYQTNSNENSWSNTYAFTSGDILILTTSSYNPPDNVDDNKYDSSYFTQKTFISDTTGLKFTLLEDVINSDQNLNFIGGYESVSSLFNFKGVLTRSNSKFDVVFNENDDKNADFRFLSDPDFISFDDGANWELINCNLRTLYGGQDSISSAYELYLGNFVLTPGIASLKGIVTEESSFADMDLQQKTMTFLTRDFGKSWEKIFDHPVILAYGDYGNIIVAVHGDPNSDGDPSQEFYYSLDQGKTWEEYEFKDDENEKGEKDEAPLYLENVKPLTKDGSGYQFVVSGYKLDGKGIDTNYHFIIDFSKAFDGKVCDSQEFEKIELNEGKCIDGQKFTYNRRKIDSECIVGKEFEDLEADIELCECTEDDFECSINFVKDSNNNCVQDISLITASGVCLESKSDVEVPVKQLKKNNLCKNSNKFNIEKETIHCKNMGISKGDDKIIIHDSTDFDSDIFKYQYFNTWEQDSILVRTTKGTLYISTDGGESFKKFDQLEPNETIVEILFNKYHGKYAYVLTSQNNLFVTSDAGKSFTKNVNAIPTDTIQLMFPIDVNAKDANKLIYYGGANCENIFNKDCHAQAYISKNGGKSFEKLLENAVHCEFSGALFTHADEDLIICEVKEKDSLLTSIVSSTDYFVQDKETAFEKSSVGFVTYKDFTIIANVEDNSLKGHITMDGKEFASVKLPKLFDDFDQRSFTIAGSTGGSIIMHLTTESAPNLEYGALLKSNNNGTSFVTIERAVNRNNRGFIDFEYVGDLEGVFITNVVTNPGKENKKLKTKISFNDGAIFRYLVPPEKNFKGEKYSCSSTDLEKCSLNLHSYTDRSDFRDSLSSGAGVGLLIGIGNVGESLLPAEKCSTFLSTDGGISWKEISSSPYQYEFGDRGNIIVLVSNDKSDSIFYSRDQGNTWKTLKISEEPILIKDVITNPTDSSMKFLLISSDYTISINFAELFERQCSFDNSNDFEYKPLLHPDSKCIFGHEVEYIHKKNPNCFVGMAPLKDKYKITKNCTCTRDDYECDYNFELSDNGVCKLVEGLSPLDPLEMCAKNPDLIEVFHPTGYRKNALSTCKGGKVLDTPSTLPQACPGKEEEFKKLHSVSSASSFVFVLFSLIAMIFTLWIVYERGIKRNGGFARFGEIRLRDENENDDDIIEENIGDVIINRIVSFGVLGFYGLSNIYSRIGKPSGKILNKFAHIIGLRRSGFRNQDYSSVSTGNRFNTFSDETESDNENNFGVTDDLLFGNDEDASNLAAFNDEDINFDIDEHLNDEQTSFHDFNEEASSHSIEEPQPVIKDTTDEEH
ncbi:hypothetical protein ACO0SA_004015 [Hanseniaspora valbyensis]